MRIVVAVFLSFIIVNICESQVQPVPDHCSGYIALVDDKTTGGKAVAMKTNVMLSDAATKTGFNIYASLADNAIRVSITIVEGTTCVKQGDVIQFLFTDGSELQLAHSDKTNCNVESIFFLGGTPDREKDLAALTTKMISKLKVWAHADVVEKSFPAEKATSFQESLKCLKRELSENGPLRQASNAAKPDENKVAKANKDNQIFMVVEQQPEFIGGYEALTKFIKKNIRYPEGKTEPSGIGIVYVSFLVGVDGTLKEIKTIRGVNEYCDQEAVRVIQSMPAWRPGKLNGKVNATRFVLPVKF